MADNIQAAHPPNQPEPNSNRQSVSSDHFKAVARKKHDLKTLFWPP